MNVPGVNTILQPSATPRSAEAFRVSALHRAQSAQKAEGEAALKLIGSSVAAGVSNSDPDLGTQVDRRA